MQAELHDGRVLEFPDGTSPEVVQRTVQSVLRAERIKAQEAADRELYNPTKGMSFVDKFLAGAGKAVADTGFGAKQLGAEALDFFSPKPKQLRDLIVPAQSRGDALRAEADERKRLDAPLMDTGAGMAGNIGGNVAMALLPGGGVMGAGKAAALPGVANFGRAMLSAPSTLRGVGAGIASGAVQGALQPVGTDDSRTGNVIAGGAVGGLIPAATTAVRAGREVARTMTDTGRREIVGRAINRAVGSDAPAIMQRLRGAQELVPGALPTAADVGESGGLAALQRAASAIDPQAYAARNSAKVDAWRSAIGDIAGDEASMKAAEAARKASSGALYGQADNAVAQLDSTFQGLMQRPQFASAVARAQELAKNDGIADLFFRGNQGEAVAITGQGAHFIKKALDEAAEHGSTSYTGKAGASAAGKTQGVFLDWLEKQVPEYGAARQAFAKGSEPINQMQIGQFLQSKMNPALTAHGQIGGVNANQLARAVNDAPKLVKTATGQSAQRLEDVMTPQQIGTIQGLLSDMARTQNANNLGRGVGSDTVQKLGMANLLDSTGLPTNLISNAPGIGPGLNWMFKNSDDTMRALLAEGLLDPRLAAQLMEQGAKAGNTATSRAASLLGNASRLGGQGLLASQLAQ